MDNYRAKYPPAIVSKMIDLFGDHLLFGYNIGCGFSKTADNSALVGPKKRRAGLKIICNSFHGHAHCCGCRLEYHPMDIVDASNEDFEGCESLLRVEPYPTVHKTCYEVSPTSSYSSAFRLVE